MKSNKQVALAIITLALGIEIGSVYHASFASQTGQIELAGLFIIGVVLVLVSNRKK
ncbi:MAG: hypothetical protein JWL75_684 [Parcubacteria group bacterium]|nr:hypothetical protein [Parcubacteria group bacterium]